jgi:hypothetical protein
MVRTEALQGADDQVGAMIVTYNRMIASSASICARINIHSASSASELLMTGVCQKKKLAGSLSSLFIVECREEA